MIINLFGTYVNANHIATLQNVGTDEDKKTVLTLNSSITFEGKTAEDVYKEIQKQVIKEKLAEYTQPTNNRITYRNGGFI